MTSHLSASKRAKLQADTQNHGSAVHAKTARVIPTVRSRSSMVFVSAMKGREVNVKPIIRLNTRHDQAE